MSSESSDDCMSCTYSASQESNANDMPSSSNATLAGFSGLTLADRQPIPVWRPQVDSDYDSDNDPTTGKRKQSNQQSEAGDSIQKRKRAYEEMEWDDDEEVKALLIVLQNSVESMQTQQAEASDSDEESEDEDSEEESEEENDGQQEAIVAVPTPYLSNVNRPSTSRMKRKWGEPEETVTAPKMSRQADSEEEDD